MVLCVPEFFRVQVYSADGTQNPSHVASEEKQITRFSIRVTDSPTIFGTQRLKGRFPMCVTDSFKVMLAREVQPAKAYSPMCVTDSFKVMLAREVQPSKAYSPM